MSSGKNGLGSAAVHSLYQRFDRETERHFAYECRVICWGEDDDKYVFDFQETDVYWCTADIGG